MSELDLAAYDVEAINRAEKHIREDLAKSFSPTRREAAAFHMKVCAQLIADDVLSGVDQWPPRLEEYRYLRDLTAHLYGQAEGTLAAIDGKFCGCPGDEHRSSCPAFVPSGTGWPVA